MIDSAALLPRVDSDRTRIAGFSTSVHEQVVRVLLPGVGDHDCVRPWSQLALAAGLELEGTLRWSELLRALPRNETDALREAGGRCDPLLAAVLVDALTVATGTPQRCTYMLWPGFAGELDGVSVTAPKDQGEELGRNEGLVLHDDALAWLRTRAENGLSHFPVYLWPQDQAFLVACPIYHDSLYVSGSATLAGNLKRTGLDVVDVTRDMVLPSEGD